MTPTARPGDDSQNRIVQRVSNIEDGESLIRYAVAAQLAQLPKEISQRQLGKVLSTHYTTITHGLSGQSHFSSKTLRELDEAVDTAAPNRDHVAGLAQFGVRMRGLRDRESLTASIPPAWTAGEGDGGAGFSDDELHVLAHASNLLRRFLNAHKLHRGSASIRNIYEEEIIGVVDRLILIAGAPPTPRNVEAQILLGSLAKYAFHLTLDRLEISLRTTPLGFRTWRSLTKLLLLTLQENDEFISKGLRARLARLISEANRMRSKSIYPGRSLDLELATSVPPGWLQSTSVTAMLMARAQDPAATLRERGTAALGLWERALLHDRGRDPQIIERMNALMRSFKEAETERPDVASGLRWVSTTIDHVIRRNIPVCNDWPDVDEPWFEPIAEAAALLEQDNLPNWIQSGTKQLFMHILLQNAGVQRRRAIDALTAGGWVEPVVRALASVLRDERTDGWVRLRAIFALGFMQHRSATSTQSLISACREAYHKVCAVDSPSKSDISELHAVLFAIGDAFGAPSWERQARSVRDELEPLLVDLVENRVKPKEMHQVARAIVYTLTFTAQKRGKEEPADLSQRLLQALANHPDGVTADFSRWALKFRFGDNGDVYPILRAAT